MGNSKIKILLLSTGDRYGAYEAMYRIGKALKIKYDVLLVVKNNFYKEDWIIPVSLKRKSVFSKTAYFIRKKLKFEKNYDIINDKYVFLKGENEKKQFVSADKILKILDSFVPDIVISGMTDGFVNTTTLLDIHKITKAKIFQQMVDIFPLTGGCHISWGCNKFKTLCTNCPAANTKAEMTIIESNHKNRINNIQSGNFHLLTVKGWSLEKTNESAVYNKRGIPLNYNLIDTEFFTDKQRDVAKVAVGLKNDDFVIFTGAYNANSKFKGANEFAESLLILQDKLTSLKNKNIKILIVGNNIDDNLYKSVNLQFVKMPFVMDYRYLSLIYQAADIVVVPSIEDAGPMMTCEALASGTPVVGFKTGSLFDDGLIQDGVQGFRVSIGDVEALANSIFKIISLDNNEYENMRKEARLTALKNASVASYLDEFESKVCQKFLS